MWQQQQKHFSYHMQSPIKWKTAHMFLAINSVVMLVQAEWCPQSGKPWTRHHQVHRADKAAQTQRHSSLWGDNTNFQAQQWTPTLLPFLSIHFPSKNFLICILCKGKNQRVLTRGRHLTRLQTISKNLFYTFTHWGKIHNVNYFWPIQQNLGAIKQGKMPFHVRWKKPPTGLPEVNFDL